MHILRKCDKEADIFTYGCSIPLNEERMHGRNHATWRLCVHRLFMYMYGGIATKLSTKCSGCIF